MLPTAEEKPKYTVYGAGVQNIIFPEQGVQGLHRAGLTKAMAHRSSGRDGFERLRGDASQQGVLTRGAAASTAATGSSDPAGPSAAATPAAGVTTAVTVINLARRWDRRSWMASSVSLAAAPVSPTSTPHTATHTHPTAALRCVHHLLPVLARDSCTQCPVR